MASPAAFSKIEHQLIHHHLGDHDVFAGIADKKLDGKRYRTSLERGFHLAEPIPRLERTSQKLQWTSYWLCKYLDGGT